jgi:hypothetical protein
MRLTNFSQVFETNDHHQNRAAERAIESISNIAKSIILHATVHWKDGIDESLWPQAVTYSTRIYNNTLKDGVCPAGVCIGSAVPWHQLMYLHVWGCSLYVLDTKIQTGQNLPRWEPRSNRGCSWVSVNSTQAKFIFWSSILALESLPLSFMWCLMVSSPQYLPLREILKHLIIGRNCVS